MNRISFLAGALNYNESDGLDDLDTLQHAVGLDLDSIESYVMGYEYAYTMPQLTAERMLIEAKLPGSFPWAWHRLWGNNPTKVIVGGPVG